MNLFSRTFSVSAALCLCLVLLSCGGSSMPKPVSDYSLSATPATITLVPGGAARQVTIGVSAINGMTGAVTVAISGLPGGVVAQPATLSIAPGNYAECHGYCCCNRSSRNGHAHRDRRFRNVSHTSTVMLTVSAPPPDYTLALSPTSLNVTAGQLPPR